MRLIKTMMVGLLGSATLLPALPAWAEVAPVQGATIAPAGQAPASTQPKAATASPTPAPAPVPQASASDPAAKPVAGNVSMDDGMSERLRICRDNRKAFLDAHLAALHAGLELTPAQDATWSPVETAIRALADARHGMHHDRHADASGQDFRSAERLRARGTHLIAMGQAMEKLADATGPLLQSLSREQKHRLPVLLRGLKPHRAVALAFDTDPRFGDAGRPWKHRFGRGEGGNRFMFFADRFGGLRDGDGWDPREGRFGWSDREFDGGHRHHHGADRGGAATDD